ncbi:MAG: thermonuclease family protein [Chloroflexi bacterium]|nr:thermonuclease family protein [Chloroflexota bacterium]
MKLVVAMLVANLLLACSTTETVTDLFDPSERFEVQVVNVVDGDTIDVLIDGIPHRVRYIGIDTPETVHPARGVEPYGKEASARNRELVEGVTVYLEKDVSETDRYDRLLRYVWLEDGTMVNEMLVAEGYAQVSTFPPDVKYAERFLVAQRAARDAGLGLWGLSSTSTGDCDAAYPDVCIPPPPPDLDCGQITFTNFTVLAADPHRFDGDGNGVGCEGR